MGPMRRVRRVVALRWRCAAGATCRALLPLKNVSAASTIPARDDGRVWRWRGGGRGGMGGWRAWAARVVGAGVVWCGRLVGRLYFLRL